MKFDNTWILYARWFRLSGNNNDVFEIARIKQEPEDRHKGTLQK